MSGFWKPFRVAVSIAVLLSMAFIFVDFRHVLPSSWYKAITFFQFVPSFRKFLVVPGLISCGFILVLFLSLAFGRVYCSLFCPLGIFQDLFSFFSKKFRKKARYKYANPQNIVRYTVLTVTLVPMFFGSLFLLSLLDPYSNFGRIFSDLFKPVYNIGNNLLADIMIKFNNYSLSPFDLSKTRWVIIIYPVFVLGIIIAFSWSKGRLFCNTVCPVGSFLGLVSRIAIFRVAIDKKTCSKCGKCSFVCKSQCIDIKSQTVDVTRCVGCFNCLTSCETNSISYKNQYKLEGNPVQKNDTDAAKRRLLLKGVLLAGALAGIPRHVLASVPKKIKKLIPVKKNHYSTPPGSISVSHFNSACTSCHLCIAACPSHVLQPSFLEYGLASMFQPYLDYHSNYCQIDCTKCSHVCPTGAILPLSHEAKKTTQIGTAKFIKQNCVVFNDETSCGACSEHCPTQAVTMVPYKGTLTIPDVDDTICIGCGACEYACPARPYRAIYVEGNPVHKTALKPRAHKLEDTPSESFPF